ncbi:MaoC/PaaZ C-terminal domain-containing protein [Bradyrhizobium sp. DASA03007]|uniref:MaoC/PaaZ C-terminal domain-containing protein n=1 Tax=unclassified Bradyrhizobium TaxID=2631580 RepID=UPI003F721BA8
MVDYAKTRAWRSGDVRHAYATRDTILYALGVGAASDPLDERQLRLVYEKNLVALPTMATVLASPGAWMRDNAELGINFAKMVHGEQSVQMHAVLPPSGVLVGRSRVARLVDKGDGKGAVMHVEKELWDEATNQLVAVGEQVLFLRGDGGFSQGSGGDEPASAPMPVPDHAPDRVITLPTRVDQAVLYRLSGDLNPLHIDPDFATKVGFTRPILHGLATYGFACRGLVEAFCDSEPSRLKAIRARMSAPVFPGDTIRLECWRLDDRIAFQARVTEREALVLSHGWAST